VTPFDAARVTPCPAPAPPTPEKQRNSHLDDALGELGENLTGAIKHVTSIAGVGKAHGEMAAPPAGGTAAWSSGLCGALADPVPCAATCCLPCWTVPRTMSAMDGRTCEGHFLSQLILNACCCLGLVQKAKVRSDYRSRHGIAGSAVSDLLLTICCLPCATCQEASDVSLRRGQPVVPFGKPSVGGAADPAAAAVATTAPAAQVMDKAAEQAESGAAEAVAAVKPSQKK